MSLTTDTTMQVVPAYGGGGNSMWGGDWASWIVLFLIFGMFGWGGNGGFGGFGGGAQQGYDTRADIQRGFDNQAVVGKLDGITQGICDSTYTLSNAITNGFNNTNMGMMQGFNGVERSFCNLSAQMADCCCTTQRAIDGVRYDMATQACDTRNTIQNTTRDIIENANANSKAILDALNQNYIRTLESENQGLKLAASQANQNAVLMAAMDANKAEILRRTGAECPTPAYVVQPPQPVTFPNFCNNNCGCGCGC